MPALPPTISDAAITSKPYSWVPATGLYYGYCTYGDVQAEFLDVGNMPTSASNPIFLAQCIIDTAVEMQNALEEVYVMPYAGTNLGIAATLNEMNRKLAASVAYDRIFGANEPDQSARATDLRGQAESRLLGIINGEEQWGSPFGDALPQAEKVAYPAASAATITPNPYSGDPIEQQPIFTITQNKFRSNLM